MTDLSLAAPLPSPRAGLAVTALLLAWAAVIWTLAARGFFVQPEALVPTRSVPLPVASTAPVVENVAPAPATATTSVPV